MAEEAPVVGEPAMQEDVAGGGRTEQEVASQPACWRRAGQLAADFAGVLPARGERVAVAGCGTSWFMAQSYAAAREASGHGETDAFAASEMPLGRAYDRVVVLSRSGTTTEIVQLLERLRGTAPTVAITAVPGTPVPEAADAVIDLSFADEESVVQTRFATTELVLLRAHLGVDPGRPLTRPSGSSPRRCPRRCWLRASSRSSVPGGPMGWPTRPRSSCVRRPACGPRPTRPWSTGTARSP